MGCQYLSRREDLAPLMLAIQHHETECRVLAEKQVLVALSGGCFAPIGVLATLDGENMRLRVRVASADGQRCAESDLRGAALDWEAIVQQVVKEVQLQGGGDIVAQMRQSLQSGAG